MTTDSDIPVIDFGPFLDHSNNNNNNSNNEGEECRSRRREETAEEIRRACLDHGFFYATHHGIDPALLDAVWEQTEALFDLSPSQKSEISSKHDPLFRGYISTEDGLHSCNSKLRDELGVDDQKESYTIGATESSDDDEDDKTSKAGKSPMHGPNQWPKSSDLPSFRTTMEAYWEAQIVFSRVLARGIALSLGLPPGFFDPHLTDPVAQMVLLRYPSPPSNTMTTGCGTTEAETEKACRTKHPGCGERA